MLNASSNSFTNRIIDLLKSEFLVTNLGKLSFFLGIFVQRSTSNMFLCQEIFHREKMSNCKSVTTPVDTKSKLSAEDGAPVLDPSLYRSLEGALQYLTFTRPNIAYAIQQVCLFMHAPREPHFKALKRIIRYIKGTLDYVLHLYPFAPNKLISSTDVD